VSQNVAAWCSVLTCTAMSSGMLQCDTTHVDSNIMRPYSKIGATCVAVCCSVLQCVAVLQSVAVYCSVLQCVAVCCSVLYCAAECFSVL